MRSETKRKKETMEKQIKENDKEVKNENI